MAQEVQKLFPELVKQAKDKKQTLSLFYQGLVPVLINAIKDQQKQLEELRKMIKHRSEN